MNILCIGGTGFIGAFTIPQLLRAGHKVIILHRGNNAVPSGAEQIIGDRNSLEQSRPAFLQQKFDLVVDFVLSSEKQARQLMEVFRGIAGRVVALSSMDVYRAFGVFYGLEPGDLEPLPITEDSSLRTQPLYPPEVLKRLRQTLSWLDDEYDKIPVEKTILSVKDLPGTVLRLPMIYGPGDYIHRFHPVLKRIDDGRRYILFAENVAQVRTPRGYIEDVAAGIALAITSQAAAGHTYNISESGSFTELEFARKIASAAGWKGEFVVLPPEKTPAHLQVPYNTAQHFVVSSERIRRELGYREITSERDAFQRTIAWERANPPRHPVAQFDYAAEDAALQSLKLSA